MRFLPIFLPLLFLLPIAVQIIIAVLTYKDAEARDMDTVIWPIVSLLIPLWGVVVYCIFRIDKPEIYCSNCGGKIKKEHIACPSCGIKLKKTCNNCGFELISSWSHCPRCAQAVSDQNNDFRAPVEKPLSDFVKKIVLIYLISIAVVILSAFLGIYLGFLSIL